MLKHILGYIYRIIDLACDIFLFNHTELYKIYGRMHYSRHFMTYLTVEIRK